MKFRYFKFPLPERSAFFGTSILKPIIPIAPHGYGILGQKGFFDIFVVKFDLLKEGIELQERSR